jgi:hypothetical protein
MRLNQCGVCSFAADCGGGGGGGGTAAAGVVKEAFTAAFQQQHRTSRAVLEGAFRGFDEISESAEHQQGNLLQLSCFCNNKDWLLALACNSTSHSAAVLPAAAVSEAAKAAEEATAAAAAGPGTAVGHSLLVSCVKLFQAVQAVHKAFAWQAVELAVQVAAMSCAAAAEVAQQNEAGTASAVDGQSRASGSKSAAAAAAWYWLCGRCLVLAGVMLQQFDAALQDFEATVLQARVQQTPKQVFGGIAAAVTNLQSALGGQLDAAAKVMPAGAAAARERLVFALGTAAAECSEDLEQLLLAARGAADNISSDETDSSSSSSSRGGGSTNIREHGPYPAVQCLQEVNRAAAAAAAAVIKGQQGLGQQLEALGRAVCGVSASSACCNNPSCSSRAQLSESALVGGKSSRCSACKVARYCSRDCQVRSGATQMCIKMHLASAVQQPAVCTLLPQRCAGRFCRPCG